MKNPLYLIEILHQTTTRPLLCLVLQELYLIEILHQTTTRPSLSWPLLRCILSKFYIKPQLEIVHSLQPCVVSYRNSTSNHNNCMYNEIRAAVVSYRNSTSNHNTSWARCSATPLYLIEILHQTTTVFLLLGQF